MMLTSDTVLYTPGRIADLFAAVFGAGEGDPDETADAARAIGWLGYSSPAVRYVYRREVMAMSDAEIAFTEGLDPDTVRERIENALSFMSDNLNGRH